MRGANEAMSRSDRGEFLVRACRVLLMEEELAWRRQRRKKEPPGADDGLVKARSLLAEQASRVTDPGVAVADVRDFSGARQLLGQVESTAKGVGILVGLSALQPWAEDATRPMLLEPEPQRAFLERVSIELGGDTTPQDVELICKTLYPHQSRRRAVKLLKGSVVLGPLLALTPVGFLGLGALVLMSSVGVFSGFAVATAFADIASSDVSPQAVQAQTLVMTALHDALMLHGQQSQAAAQRVVAEQDAYIRKLEAEIARLDREDKRNKAVLKDLEAKLGILMVSKRKMETSGV